MRPRNILKMKFSSNNKKQANVPSEKFIKLEDNEEIICQPNTGRKQSFKQSYKRMSFYLKHQSVVPSVKQAQIRQNEMKKFHQRSFYKKQKHLQQIFNQNMRIYGQLQKQSSSYYFPQSKKTKRKQRKSIASKSVASFSNLSRSHTNLTRYENKKQLNKSETSLTKRKHSQLSFQNMSTHSKNKFERRYSFSSCKRSQKIQKTQTNDNNIQFRKQKDSYLRIKHRYEKNKTETRERKNSHSEIYMFQAQNKQNFNEDIQKYPAISFTAPKVSLLDKNIRKQDINSSTFVRSGKRKSSFLRC